MTWAVKMADARYDGYDEGFEKGIATGREEGISIGLATGREEGISIGLATGREEGISIGLEQGLERGAYQTKLETARSFLAMGLSPEQVTLGTSLPLETVLELAQTK